MKLSNKFNSYLIIPLLLFACWYLIYIIGIFNPLMFPNPFLILSEFFELFLRKKVLIDIFQTLWRVLSSLIIGALIGIPLGLFLGSFKNLYNLFEFTIDFLRSLPPTAIFPLFMLLFGIGNLSKIALSSWLICLILLVNTAHGVHHSNKSYQKMAKVYSVKKRYLFTNITFFGTLPGIFSGLRIGISLALIVIIVTEMFIGAVDGLGYAILDSQLLYEIPRMYSIIFLTGLIGFSLNKIFLIFERRIIHWTEK